jgi:hypothetical protein
MLKAIREKQKESHIKANPSEYQKIFSTENPRARKARNDIF